MVATKSKLLFVAVSGAPLVADAFGFAPASGLSLARRASNLRAGISLRMSGEERKLTNEECELLGLPNGSTLVGEESEMMKTKLTVKGKYEDTNNLRYFGNEKIRMSNLFEKKKLEPNVKRMSQKIRRAEIEEKMDEGYSYDDAVKMVDAAIAAAAAAPQEQAQVGGQPESGSLAELFTLVDRDRSGTISAGEMATAFQRIRGGGMDGILGDVNFVLGEMDIDKDGQISFDEFSRAAELFVTVGERKQAAAAAAQKDRKSVV